MKEPTGHQPPSPGRSQDTPDVTPPLPPLSLQQAPCRAHQVAVEVREVLAGGVVTRVEGTMEAARAVEFWWSL